MKQATRTPKRPPRTSGQATPATKPEVITQEQIREWRHAIHQHCSWSQQADTRAAALFQALLAGAPVQRGDLHVFLQSEQSAQYVGQRLYFKDKKARRTPAEKKIFAALNAATDKLGRLNRRRKAALSQKGRAA